MGRLVNERHPQDILMLEHTQNFKVTRLFEFNQNVNLVIIAYSNL